MVFARFVIPEPKKGPKSPTKNFGNILDKNTAKPQRRRKSAKIFIGILCVFAPCLPTRQRFYFAILRCIKCCFNPRKFASKERKKMNSTQNQNSFYGLGIARGLLEVLDKLRFKVPTPIQYKAIPIAIEGKDIIGIAQTGTGKTLAFGIPMIQQLAQKRGRGLVLVPTRELAIQVNEALVKFAPILKMRTTVLIGGESMHLQIQSLRNDPGLLLPPPAD